MILAQLSTPFTRLLTTSATDTSFASKIPKVARPSGDAIIDLGDGGAMACASLLLQFFGEGADDTTFESRIIGWRRVGHGTTELWVPMTLAEIAVTLSTVVGVAGRAVTADERFADTLTLNTGIAAFFSGDANAQPATAIIDTMGCELAEPIFDLTGATNANCLYARA